MCSLLLSGCSAVKMGYEQSPTLLYWWLDSHVDFTEAQRPKARDALHKLQDWHRTHELPAYAQLLARMANLAEGSVSETQVCQMTQQAQAHMARLVGEAARLATPMAQTLDARQRQQLRSHWAKKNAQWDEEWLQGPPEQRLKRRVDKTVARYTDFYGKLSAAQITLVHRQLTQSLWSPEWGQQEMLRRQKLLLDTLTAMGQDTPGAPEADNRLLGLWDQFMNPSAPADRERLQAWLAQGCQHMAEFHNSTSAEQRQRAARRLRSHEKDLRELVGRSF